jgi:signal transduction histidine kinase
MPQRDRQLISAVHLATKKLSAASSIEETLREVLQICVEAVGAFGGTIYIHDPGAKALVFRHVLPESVRNQLPTEIPDNFGAAGEAFQSGKPAITKLAGSTPTPIEEATGVKITSMLSAPLMVEGMDPIGVVQLVNKEGGEFDEGDLQIIETVSAVSAMAYLNSVLMEQSNRAASMIGMGAVGHDIFNLAAALKGAVHLVEMSVDELANDDNATLKDLRESVADLLIGVETIVGYSAIINKLSKGAELTPEKKAGDFGSAVRKAAAYIEANARSEMQVGIRYDIEQSTTQSLFDSHYVNRIVQNLVGNAVKASLETIDRKGVSQPLTTDERGAIFAEVEVKYKACNECHVIEVKDSGPGMTEATIRRIIGGNASTGWSKSSGTGWGMKTVLELTAAHGGKLEIESEPGEGSLFRVSIPFEPAPIGAEAVV